MNLNKNHKGDNLPNINLRQDIKYYSIVYRVQERVTSLVTVNGCKE